MKKFISTAFVISIFALPLLAQTLPPNCHYGHINSPVLVCEPPPQTRATGEIDKKTLSDDESVLTIIETYITKYSLFTYFLN